MAKLVCVEHLAQDLRLEGDHDCRRGRHDRREIVGRQTDQPVVAPPHRSLTAALSVTLSATGGAGSSFTISASFRADTVIAPFARHLRRHRHARADLEIRRGQAHALALRLEQDVGEDRQRLARLDDVLHHLEAFEERVSVEH